ncbi:hypothetical protein RchiOBHm_Chr2g0137811 [Rosa chinensis]|uniref:Uncharacterized protein n=1 Tax=Rosa chinensis TaxID=74649 RepID=A0A2P6RWN8_ROSCH|nr:hypothetical protein RchiOBHm_Chr2g0137811 [Rosa chinensis]
MCRHSFLGFCILRIAQFSTILCRKLILVEGKRIEILRFGMDVV